MDEYANWKKQQDENLAIFHEMLSEKGIRAGTGSVGEAHKGWGMETARLNVELVSLIIGNSQNRNYKYYRR